MDQSCFNICLWILSIIIAVAICSILIKSKKFNKCYCDHHYIEGFDEPNEISVNSVNTDNITVKNDLGLKNKIMLYNGNDKSIELDNDTGNIRGTSLYGKVYGDVKGNVTGNVTGNVKGNVTGNVNGDVTGSTIKGTSLYGKVYGDVKGNVTGNVNGNVTGSTINGATIRGTSINSTNISNTGNITNYGTLTNKGTASFNNNVAVSGRITGRDLQLSGSAITYSISNTRDFHNGGNVYTSGFVQANKGLVVSNINDVKIGSKKLLDIIYPIGSIYQSTSSTSPATLFGGRWEQIKDRFLYATNSGSAFTGGSSTATLDIKNIPSHNHLFRGDSMSGRFADLVRYDARDGSANTQNGVFSQTVKSGSRTWMGSSGGGARVDFRFNAVPSGSITNTGGEYNNSTKRITAKPFSIMPPYYKVYTWRRTG